MAGEIRDFDDMNGTSLLCPRRMQARSALTGYRT
jgi:hypothetical protein